MIHQNTEQGKSLSARHQAAGKPNMGVNWLGEQVGKGQFAQQSPGMTHLRPGLIATDQAQRQIPAIVHL
jgi:hypothetical protein